jgi:predicted nucleotidyltransferase
MQTDLIAIAKRHGILLALQFGSSVSGRTHARSDVDIAVLVDRSAVTFREHAHLLQDLQHLFPGQEVDLAIINHADPLLLKKITEDCQVLYGPVEQLHRLKIYAFKRYHDHRRYFEMERQFAARSLATARSAE